MLTKVGCYVISRDNNYVVHYCRTTAYTVYYILHNKVDRTANHPFYQFFADHVYVILQGARF